MVQSAPSLRYFPGWDLLTVVERPRVVSEFLVFDGVTKRFGDVTAVNNVSLEVKKGEFFSLLGSSGCGKTTLLRMLAGFEHPDEGKIYLDGQDVTELPPNKRRVHTIFQNYALFPTMTVWDNIAFGLKIAHCPRKEIAERVEAMLDLIQMKEHAHKKPHQISGGQKQRVAIARALVNRPQVLLLDEPLAALDLKLRQHMLMELDILHDQVGITFVYVTHDQGEAMSLSDRIAVMNRGKIEQIGTPANIYEAPRSSFVAAFIGDTNFFDGKVAAEINNDYCRLEFEDFEPIICFNDKRIPTGSPVHLSIRPEKIHVSHKKPDDDNGKMNIFHGIVEDCVYQGSHTRYWVRIGEYRISVYQAHSRFLLDQEPIIWKEEVWLWWHSDDGYMLEQYRESDENLLLAPPEAIGEDSPDGKKDGVSPDDAPSDAKGAAK